MEIQHTTVTQIDKIIETYKRTEGTDIVYVCTTDLITTDFPNDIFYRDTPHPEFGNQYIGIAVEGDNITVCNADQIVNLHFGIVENDEGLLEYSRSKSEVKEFANGNTISGGRASIQSNAPVDIYKVVDGSLRLEAKFDEYNTVESEE
tara:strand:- start:546 stop:989 length:444 start_codon:yes stop_codon:yes gene_type:complete